MNVYAGRDLSQLLDDNGFFFKKKLGQNFLMNESIAARIAKASRETIPEGLPCLAVEIGPGAGALTLQLSSMFDKVIALEIDPHLIPVLSVTLKEKDNVRLECCDALTYPFSKLREDYPGYIIAVCSNLPYYITSEILMTLFESGLSMASVTVLIQREAADRLSALPGSSQYGSITAAVNYYAKTEKLFRVGPGNFYPKPKVDSCVLRLTMRDEKAVNPGSVDLFFSLIRAAFSARRKTILNALLLFNSQYKKESMLSILMKSGIDPNCRGETLSLDDFARLSDSILSWEEAR